MDAAQRAEDILFHMQKQYDDGISDIKPNLRTYNTVILGWARIGDPARAEAILRCMQKPSNSGTYWVKPDVVSYSTIISSWARSGDPSAGEQADKYLGEMGDLNSYQAKCVRVQGCYQSMEEQCRFEGQEPENQYSGEGIEEA